MADASTGDLLRRMAKSAAPPPLTHERALKLAMTRAADRTLGLPLDVLGIREEEGPLDDLLSRFDEGQMTLALRQGGSPSGLIALDLQARAAIVEAQTLGRVSPTPAEPRGATSADIALARPLLDAILAEVAVAVPDTPLGGWLDGPSLGERVASARDAAMLLPDGRYRAVRLTIDLGAGVRQGLVLLLARIPEPAVPEGEPSEATVAPLVLRSRAEVEAILHRLSLPLGEAEAMEVGQVLVLPGVTVASVRLECGGIPLGPARLGQVAGMRAVRIETPLAPDLAPLPQLGGVGTPALGLPEGSGWPSSDASGGAGWAMSEPGGEVGAWPSALAGAGP